MGGCHFLQQLISQHCQVGSLQRCWQSSGHMKVGRGAATFTLNTSYMCVLSLCLCKVASIVSDSAVLKIVARQAPVTVGFFQARILEWVIMLSSRGSSQSRARTRVSAASYYLLPPTEQIRCWTDRHVISMANSLLFLCRREEFIPWLDAISYSLCTLPCASWNTNETFMKVFKEHERWKPQSYLLGAKQPAWSVFMAPPTICNGNCKRKPSVDTVISSVTLDVFAGVFFLS